MAAVLKDKSAYRCQSKCIGVSFTYAPEALSIEVTGWSARQGRGAEDGMAHKVDGCVAKDKMKRNAASARDRTEEETTAR